MTGDPGGSEAPGACVIGWPVAHSRSPLIHGHWLAHLGLPGRYGRAAVAPGELAAFFRAMPGLGLVGGNVTVPHKQAAASLCDRLTSTAARTGSVNTIWFADGQLHGDSTDGAGFLAALDQEAPGWQASGAEDPACRALVLGAGGAARAIVAALAGRGVDVTVASRTFARAQTLARSFNCSCVPMAEVATPLMTTGLLVNTTPAGMVGQDALDNALDLDLAALPARAVVNDIVYVPRVTPLLAAAQAQGLRTLGGLGMLLHQGVPGFERWFGVRPVVTKELRALVEADIAAACP